MILKIASIHDAKAEAWLSPMFFQSNGQAIRSFADAVNNSESGLGKHPEDYTLLELGEFNQRTGALEVSKAPLALGTGINLVVQKELEL